MTFFLLQVEEQAKKNSLEQKRTKKNSERRGIFGAIDNLLGAIEKKLIALKPSSTAPK